MLHLRYTVIQPTQLRKSLNLRHLHDTDGKWCLRETENPQYTQTNACQTENAKKE